MAYNPYKKKSHKYNAKKVEFDGIVFDSKLEAALYVKLKNDPKVKLLTLQEKVYLTEARIMAKIDFKCEMQDGSTKYVEAKGMDTPVWNIKKRLWAKYGAGTLEIYKGSYKNPKLDKIIHVL